MIVDKEKLLEFYNSLWVSLDHNGCELPPLYDPYTSPHPILDAEPENWPEEMTLEMLEGAMILTDGQPPASVVLGGVVFRLPTSSLGGERGLSFNHAFTVWLGE